MHKRLWIGLLLFSTLMACNKKSDRALVISKIRKVSELATVEVILTKIIMAEKTPNGFLKKLVARNATFLANTEARIKAGIDFSKIKGDAVKIEEGTRINILLPAVQIINFSYPAETFEIDPVISRYKPFLNRISVDELDDFFRQGEIDIRNNFKYFGVRQTVEDKTRLLLTKLLKQLGFTEINIDFEEPEEDNGLSTPITPKNEEETNK
ncbi:MAG: DUF4230 domain-containing protein [Flammeovirgaceae bacterium]